MLQTALLIVLVIISLALIGLILIQQGRGADIGAAFGSGASNTVFGSQGSGNFLTRTTSALAAAFFVICLILAWYANNAGGKRGGVDFSEGVELQEVPVTDVPVTTSATPSDVPAAKEASAPSLKVEVPADASTPEQQKQ